MSKRNKFIAWFSALFTSAFLGMHALSAFAANEVVAPITDEADLQKLLCTIIGWFFWVIIVISVIMVLVAAYDYVTAGDDTEKTSRGRKRLTYAAVGIAVALLAAGVPAVVSSIFPNDPGTTLGDTCSI
jgi:hypothetical protein